MITNKEKEAKAQLAQDVLRIINSPEVMCPVKMIHFIENLMLKHID